MAVVIGIDPGSLRTGWGVVEQTNPSANPKCLGFGVIRLRDSDDISIRLAQIHSELKEIVRRFKPSEMAVEKIFFGKNALSAFHLGQARGVALAAAGANELRLAEYAARHVKKVLTGSGAASKDQVQFIIQNILSVKVIEFDASDALSLALCHLREVEVRSVFAAQWGGNCDRFFAR